MIPPALPPAVVAADAPTPAHPEAAIVTRFAPPLGRAVRYETRRTVALDSGPATFAMVQELRFGAAQPGYALDLRTISAEAEGPADVTAGFLASMNAFRRIAVRYRVRDDGTPEAVEDLDGVWAALIAAAAQAPAPAGPSGDLVRGLVVALRAYPAEARTAALLEGPRMILGFAPPTLAPGLVAPFSGQAATPQGPAVPIAGTVRVAGANAATVRFAIDATASEAAMTQAAAMLRAAAAQLPGERGAAALAAADRLATLRLLERTELVVDRKTGLAERIERRVLMVAPDGTETEHLRETTVRRDG